MKNYEIDINERVINAINYILASKIESNKAELADKFGIKPAKFSEILNKRMKAGMDIIQKLCIDYLISADWLITGEGEMLRDERPCSEAPPADRDEIISLLMEKIADKERIIADKERIIALLEEKIESMGGNSTAHSGAETA